MDDAKQIAASLSEAQRGLLCTRLWPVSDRWNPWSDPAIACDTGYSPSIQRALTSLGLTVRKTNGTGLAWHKPTPLGLAVRRHLQETQSE